MMMMRSCWVLTWTAGHSLLAERERIASSNPYACESKSLLDSARLALCNPEKVKNAFDDKGELGLFFSFLHSTAD